MSGAMTLLAGGSALALSVTSSPMASSAGGTGASQTLPSVTAAASGGSGSYTYAWTLHTAPLGGSINILNAGLATTGLSATGVVAGEVVEATIKCTATDTVSGQTAFVLVPVSYSRREGTS